MKRVELFKLFQLPGGDDAEVRRLSDSWEALPGSLAFFNRDSVEIRAWIDENPAVTFIVPNGDDWPDNCIPAENPRLAFAVASQEIQGSGEVASVSDTACIAEGATLGENVSIGSYSVIDDDVVIGDNVKIDSHVRIRSGVEIGYGSCIGSHTSIGSSGFGFEVDDSGKPVRIAHVGGVKIGSRVEIGTHVAIAQGTLKPTVIGDDVKIDDCVFIAHNVRIGRAAFVIAGAAICGSAQIGEGAWISPESTVINKAQVGDRALVGLGAVVVSDVAAATVVAGVPAKPRGER